jgi:hypothetical protein
MSSSKAAVSEEVRRTLRYVEPLSEARTPHGKRRVSARRGLAGEKSDFFSILLAAGLTARRPGPYSTRALYQPYLKKAHPVKL